MADSSQSTDALFSRKLSWIALVLLVLATFTLVQTSAAIEILHPDHHDGPNDHCCAACHGSHFPIVATEAIVHVAHLAVAVWRDHRNEARPASRERSAVNSSRAPPV